MINVYVLQISFKFFKFELLKGYQNNNVDAKRRKNAKLKMLLLKLKYNKKINNEQYRKWNQALESYRMKASVNEF